MTVKITEKYLRRMAKWKAITHEDLRQAKLSAMAAELLARREAEDWRDIAKFPPPTIAGTVPTRLLKIPRTMVGKKLAAARPKAKATTRRRVKKLRQPHGRRAWTMSQYPLPIQALANRRSRRWPMHWIRRRAVS